IADTAPDCDGDYIVINTIIDYTYRAEINITSDAIIDENGQSVLFTAGTDIELNYPFEVILGTTFEARIEPCTPLPFQEEGSGNDKSLRTSDNAFDKLFEGLINENVTVTVLDPAGNIITTNELSGSNAATITEEYLNTLAQGLYEIKIESSQNVINQKILVVK
ncbi:T9SS type A sorting domain-containing protein, partial [Saprospiraceae bacterium]|nr:T9SS type A sorting domain-containing protein [Saprospiraceae bacterium]